MLFQRRSSSMIGIQRLPQPMYVDKKVGRAAAKFFGFSEPGPDCHGKPWRTALVEKF
jgi:hypothetical protein